MAANLFIQAWVRDLQKNLFPDNSFYRIGKDDSALVNGDQVNLAQAGATPAIVKNRTEKAEAAQRGDDVDAYNLIEFSTTPVVIKWSEELIVNYAKRANITEEHAEAINTAIANYMAWAWVNNTSQLKLETSGSDRIPGLPGATGTRKALTLDDIMKAGKALTDQNMPLLGRHAIIDTQMQSDLLAITEVKSVLYSGKTPLVKGSIGHFLGFDWFIRPTVNAFTSAKNLKAETTALTATDLSGAIFCHKNAVRWAKGSIKGFIDIDNPEWQGTIVSAAARGGGRMSRKDGKGVVKMIETVGA